VHRTDRTVTFFAGDDMLNPDPDAIGGTNANLETMKDMLLTYVMTYNPDLGYVQGMSDLVAPIFVVMGDEAMTFWAFVQFMDRMKSNFYVDQSGMHNQLTNLESLIRFMDPLLAMHFEKTESTNLFFCFRWLLVWFKREFKWGDVMRLWEVSREGKAHCQNRFVLGTHSCYSLSVFGPIILVAVTTFLSHWLFSISTETLSLIISTSLTKL
jgi:hypothetical protein